MTRKMPQAVLFDFDGVLCNERFYEKALLPNHVDVYDWIERNIFGNRGLIQKWMRNQINSIGINGLIAENTYIGYDTLNELYMESIRRMELEEEVKNLAESLKLSGKKIGIVTDNMDVFTQITIPNHKLNVLFDIIINSADYGILKQDNGGKLFDIALSVFREEIENSLLIDDSEETVELYRSKGGNGFLFKSAAGLKSFLQVR